jgi:hypothetical protein
MLMSITPSILGTSSKTSSRRRRARSHLSLFLRTQRKFRALSRRAGTRLVA